MYGKYEMVVLVNQDSASSSEIFTAALRDHNKADIVGMKTYGKGSMQTTVPLEIYGEEYFGAIKLTTKLHYPPSGESYDGGIGIAPDYEVELEGVAAETHFYKLTEEIDNQLQKAVSLLID
jgi:carboxyl-terminal processing protease